MKDFLSKDNELLNKIKSSDDRELLGLLRQLNPNVKVKEDRENYDLHRKNKLRMINPSIYRDRELIPASKLSERVRVMGNIAYEKATEGMYVRVISN